MWDGTLPGKQQPVHRKRERFDGLRLRLQVTRGIRREFMFIIPKITIDNVKISSVQLSRCWVRQRRGRPE
jgi:hypothetical protein